MPGACGAPYAEYGPALAAMGMAVMPCGGEDGKRPLLAAFQNLKRPYSVKAVEGFARKYPTANLGIITSASRLTIVDIDSRDPAVCKTILDRFGDTPLITATPSGGRHLWYRSSGERNANLRSAGFEIDIKGTGAGIIIAPPSSRPGGACYSFEKGDWNSLCDLPGIPAAALTSLKIEGRLTIATGRIRKGERNDSLFRFALNQARYCDDKESLLDLVEAFVECLEPPLSSAEILRAVESAWGYEQRGENWIGGPAMAGISETEFLTIVENPEAVALLCHLRQAHGARNRRNEPFAISPRAMTKTGALASWGESRIRKARDTLETAGLIEKLHHGGRGKRDPSLYRLGSVRNPNTM